MSKPLILIVEDDEATAELLTDLLLAEGYDTRTLPTAQASEMAGGGEPDLVLLDLVLLGSSAEDLVRSLRGDHNRHDLPVLLISAAPRLADMAAKLPVQGYVSKPFELDSLMQAVSDLLAGWRQSQAQHSLRWPEAGLVPGI